MYDSVFLGPACIITSIGPLNLNPLICADGTLPSEQAAEGKSLTNAMASPSNQPTTALPTPGSLQELESAGGSMWTHTTLAATMSEATALSAGLCQGDIVEVTARNKW